MNKLFNKAIKINLVAQILLVTGMILIITGLIFIIFWQSGFVQIKWLECPKEVLPFS